MPATAPAPPGVPRAATVADRWRRVRGVPVLLYHLVTDDAVPPDFGKYAVTPAELARHVRLLQRLGCTTVTMDELHRARTGGPPLPARAVAITFDDGFRDCARHAAPLLAAAGMTATFFLVAGLLGARARWLEPEGLSPELVDAGEARELEAAGLRCESHGLTHRRLAALDDAQVREELVRSRAVLEEALGRPVRHLAYPHGSSDARVRALAAGAGYRTACGTAAAKHVPGDDPFDLPRVMVAGGDTVPDVLCRLVTSRTVAGAGRVLTRPRSGA